MMHSEIITSDEERILKESIEEFKSGNTIRLEDLKRDDE